MDIQRQVDALKQAREPSFMGDLGLGFVGALLFVILLLLPFLLRNYL